MSDVHMPNPILFHAHNIMCMAMPLYSGLPEYVGFDQCADLGEQKCIIPSRKKILEAFSTFDKQISGVISDGESIHMAKYALAAYVDEAVMHSDSQEKNDWMRQPLQLEFFGENLAGEGFFMRLEQLRKQPSTYIDLLELYYVCMRLGFKGKYRVREREILLGLLADLRGQIEGIRGSIAGGLFVGGCAVESSVGWWRGKFLYRAIGAGICGVMLICYIWYAVLVNIAADKSVAHIEAQNMGAVAEGMLSHEK